MAAGINVVFVVPILARGVVEHWDSPPSADLIALNAQDQSWSKTRNASAPRATRLLTTTFLEGAHRASGQCFAKLSANASGARLSRRDRLRALRFAPLRPDDNVGRERARDLDPVDRYSSCKL